MAIRASPPCTLFEELEPRLLLSADGLAGLDTLVSSDERELGDAAGQVLPAHQEFSPPTASEVPPASTQAADRRHEIVFVDGGIDDHEALVAGFLGADSDERRIDVVVLDPTRDGIAQITDVLAGFDDLDAVHVLSHGDDASLRLGSTTLDDESLERYREAIAGWAGALDSEADLLLYGCNLAASEDGRALISTLAALTGADVAASDDLTGSAELGGDWALEFTAGAIETRVAPGAEAQAQWSNVLATPAEDSFEGYPLGPIGGNGGGSGWAAGSWSSPSVYDINVVASGLTHPSGGPGADTAAVELDAQNHAFNFATYSARELVAPLGAATETVWASFLLEPADTNAGSYFGIGLGNGQSFNTSTQMFAGYKGTDFVLENLGASLSHSAPGAATGVTAFLVLKLDLSAGAGIDTATLYVNPTAGLTDPEPATAQVVKSDMSVTNLTHIALIGGTDEAANPARIDQIRFASSYADVAPTTSNDPLVVATTGNTVLFTEDAGATPALFAAAMDTVEAGDTISQVVLTLANVEAGDTLVFGVTSVDLNTNAASGPDANGFTYTVSSAGATPVVTVTHAGATDTLTNTMLNSLAFNNTSNNDPSTTARTVTLTSVTDSGTGLTADGTVATVNVAKTATFQEGVGGYVGTEDTRVTEDLPTTDHGNDATIRIDNASGTDDQGLIRFENLFGSGPNQIPLGSTIHSASLTVNVTDGSASGATIELYQMLSTWNESTTWNPTGGILLDDIQASSTADSSLPNPDMLGSNTFSGLEAAIQAWSNGATNYGWAIISDSSNGLVFSSSEAGTPALRPSLTINYTPPLLAADITSNLVLHQTFDADASDSTANNYDGTLQGDAFVDPADASDKIGVAKLSLDGAGDFVDLNPHAASVGSLTEGTIAAWIRTSASGTQQTIFSISDTADSNSYASLRLTAANQLFFAVRENGTLLHVDSTATNLADGQWHHVAVTVGSGGNAIYIDGAAATGTYINGTASSTNFFADVTNVDTMAIGKEEPSSGPQKYFNGLLDDVRIYGRVLSANDIAALYANNDAPINSVPGPQSTNEDTALVFSTANGNLISISDADAGGDDLAVTLEVNDGTLNLSGTTGLTFVSGSNNSGSMTVSGTLPNINAALDGLTFLPNPDFGGAVNLQVTSHDDTSLIGIYTFDDPANLGNDNSPGSLNNGVVNGATPVNDATRGDVLSFDGVDDGVQISGLLGQPADVTLSAWINFTKADPGEVISLGGSVVLRAGDWGAADGVRTSYYDGSWQNLDFSTPITGTGWRHVAFVFDDTNNMRRVYLDGVEVASAATLTSITHGVSADTYIGQHPSDPSNFFFEGMIDDARIYGRALTAAEITSTMNGVPTSDSDNVAITVTNVDDPLLVSATGNTVLFTEDAGATTALFAAAMDTVESGDTVTQVVLTLANVEAGDTLVFGATSVDLNTNSASGPDANGFTYTVSSAGASPVVTITHAGTDDATVNAMLNSLVFNNTSNNDPGTTARTVTLTSVTDSGSGLTADGTVATVNVAVADDPLVVSTTGNTVLFTEDAGATTALFAAAMDTVEAGDTISQVVLTLANVEAGDTLTFGATSVDLNSNGPTGPDANGFSYTVSSAGASPVVTITHAGASDTLSNTMLNSLVFDNTSNNDPGTTARTVTLTSVTDSGSGLTADGTVSTINVAKTDDPLAVATTGNSVLFTEDAGATTALFAATMDTVETGDTISQLVLTLANVEAGDTLVFGATSVDLNSNGPTGPDGNGFTYTVSSAGAAPLVTITHAGADDTTANTMLNSLVFNNTSNNDPGTTARTVTLTSVTDSGSGLTNDGTVATVNMAVVDDPLNVATTGNSVLFTEDAGATTALFAAAMDTVEAGDTISQVVLTLANVEAGDTLVFGATSVDLNSNGPTGPDANGFTYTVSSAGATPVVTITHAGATDTLTNTMLNSLVFNNTTNDDPSTTARTVTLTSVTDSGSGLTADGTVATVNVATADDPLAVSTTGNSVLFTEDAGATTALFAATMDTVESGDTISQLVLTLANVEAGDTLVFGATSVDLNTNAASGPDANGFTYTVSSAGAAPLVTISHAGADDTTVNTMLNSLAFNNTSNNDPGTTARTVTLTSVTDSGSGLTADGTVATVNVANADDPMVVSTTGNSVLFTEDGGATTALFAAAMDTVESGDTVSQLVLALANVEAGDTLVFGATSVDLNTNGPTGPDANGFTYTVSSAGASPVVTISHAGATDTLTNTMLNSLVFNNTTNDDPSTTARTVTLTSVTDSGSGLTADGTVATVNVAVADDPISVATTGNTVLFTEDGGPTTALFTAAMDTVETGDTITQVVLTLANVEAGDTLTFGATSVDLNTNGPSGPDANGFTYTVSSAGATPVVTISHAGATDTLTNTMLNSLVFNNTTNNDPSTTARTVTLTSVTDSGTGLTADGTVATVNVAKADDPLAVSTTGNTVLFTEGGGATTALFAAALDTIEAGDTVSQVVLTLANVEAGDTLTFGATSVDLNTNGASGPDANGFTYTVSSAGATPVVTISHAGASDALSNTMLNSLVFDNTSNNDPGTTARTVTLTSVTDSGSGLTNDGTVATVNMAVVDDPLNVATTGNSVLFTEDAGATTALFAAAMDTVEAGDTVSQMVLTLANVEAGDTLTFGATSVDLNTNGASGPDANGFTYTVSSAGAAPLVTITHAGADDATVNTMLNSLVFNNTTNDDPGTTARTVTLTSVTDSGSGVTADGTVATVNVAKADDPLAVSTTGNTVLFTEGGGATTALFAAALDTIEAGDTVSQMVLTLANVEAGDTLTFGATSVDLNTNGATGPDANGFTYTVSSAGASPVVTITHAGATDTLTNTMMNSLVFNNTTNNDPSTTARTVTLTSVTDSGSGLTADGTVATVNVAVADDPMVVSTTGNTVLFTEGAGATTALFAATMDTVESGDTVTQVVLTLANVEAGDALSFGATSVDLNTNGASGPDANGFTYTVSSAGASPVMTITHAGTDDATVNSMLNSLVFSNTANNDPGTTARTVTLTGVTDSGSGLTADGTVATVNMAVVDDPLSVATTGNSVLFTEDAGATTALFAAAMDTVESGDTISQVVLTLANVEAGDTLVFGATSVDLNTNAASGPDANGFTYTVFSAGATPIVTITHAGASDTLTNTMLNSLVFKNTSNNDPGTTARTVTLTSVTDSGSGLTNDGTVATVNVAKADDPLGVSTTGNTVLFTEDAGATTALFAAAMDTVESGDTISQVVLTLANVEAGDTLVFGATSVDLNSNGPTGPDGNGFTYTVSSAGATPVVTITHAGTDDTTVNTMLNSLVFNNTANNDPSTTARTVTLTSVTDSGSGLTNDGTVATINVAKADDPLSVATTGNTVLFTEDGGPTTALFTAAMDTVETGDTISQVVLTLANVEAGDTLTFGATSVDLNTNGASGPDANGFTYTVSSAGASPVMTITHAGTDDATVNSMLNSLVFSNTANNDPGTTARTVTLTGVTDSGSGLTADGTVATVNMAVVDDPLAVATTGNSVLFTEDAGATTALFAAAMDTVEAGDTISQVVLTLANVEAGDTLVFGATSVDLNTNAASGPDANGFTYTVSSAGATPVVTISHAGASDTLTNTMLNSLVFNNTTSNDPGTTARTVTLTSVTDSGSGLTNDGTVATINVAKADDPLSVATTGNTVLFTEDAGATTALFAATMDTVESGDTISQLVLTLANVEAGDTLVFGATSVDLNTNGPTGPDGNGFTYTVSSAGATPVVTISHAGADDTTVNTMLNSLVFNNTTNDDPGTTARTVTLTSVTDSGSGLTNDGTVATVNVAKTNDAPSVSLINVVTSLPETTSTATAIKIADIVIADADPGANNLTLTGDDFARFEIVGAELRLRAGTSLDYETAADVGADHVFDVTVVVDDPGAGGTPDGTAATTLAVTDVNEDPSGTGTLTTTGLNDNVGATSLFGGLAVSDPDAGEIDLSLTIRLTIPGAGTITGGGFTETGVGTGIYAVGGLTVAQADAALAAARFTPTDNTGPSGTFATDISVTVNDQGGGGERDVLSPTTVTITRVNSAPTGLPVISGTLIESQVLTATTTGISDADGLGTFTFQWLRDGVPIGAATGSNYSLSGADLGSNIAVRVDYTDGDGAAESVTSAARGPVGAGPTPVTSDEPEGLPRPADNPEEAGVPQPLDEFDLSAVLPPTGDPVVTADAPGSGPTQGTFPEDAPADRTRFLERVVGLLDATAAAEDPADSGNSGGALDAYRDARAQLRDELRAHLDADVPTVPEARVEAGVNQALIAEMEKMQVEIATSGDTRIADDVFRQNMIKGTFATLSVGSLTWLLRAGSLLAGVFSSIPMWSTMDPLPVLALSRREKKRRQKEMAKAGALDLSERRMDQILEHSDKPTNSRDAAS